MKHIIFLSTLLIAVFLSSSALADDSRFQFRATLGAGYLSTHELSSDTIISGSAGAFEVYFGGLARPGTYVGLLLSDVNALAPSVSFGNASFATSNSVSLNLLTVGPYVDYYPYRYSGMHFVGNLGFADMNLQVDNLNHEAVGLALGLGVGYDWRLTRNWSAGILGRMQVAAMTYADVNGENFQENSLSPTLSFSISYR